MIELTTTSPMIERLAWTLIHFLWQAAAGAAVVGILLFVTRRVTASVRYALASIVFAATIIAPVVTFFATADGATASAAYSALWERSAGWLEASEDGLPAAWLRSIVGSWLIGVSVFALRLLDTPFALRRLHDAQVPVGDDLRKQLSRLSARMGVSRGVRLLESTAANVPLTFGWLRPVIVLPRAVVAALTRREIEAVLLHELAHIRRYDYVVNVAQRIAETVFFFHPAVWWMSSVMSREREFCCDEMVVEMTQDRVGYARVLAEVESLRHAKPCGAVAATDGPLVGRIRRILGDHGYRPGGRQSVAVAAVAMTVAVSVAWVGVRAPERAVEPIVVDVDPVVASWHGDAGEDCDEDCRIQVRTVMKGAPRVVVDSHTHRMDISVSPDVHVVVPEAGVWRVTEGTRRRVDRRVSRSLRHLNRQRFDFTFRYPKGYSYDYSYDSHNDLRYRVRNLNRSVIELNDEASKIHERFIEKMRVVEEMKHLNAQKAERMRKKAIEDYVDRLNRATPGVEVPSPSDFHVIPAIPERI